MAQSLFLKIYSWAWILSAISSVGVGSDDLSQKDHIGNDNPYNYYDNSLKEADDADDDENDIDSDERIDICALTSSIHYMTCKCWNSDTSVLCVMFATISDQSYLWDALAEIMTVERLHFTSASHSNASYFPTHVLRYLENLSSLKVENLHLASIEKDAFSHLYKLTDIDLNNNHIESLEFESFKDLPELKELTLSENYLTAMSVGTFDNLPKLRTLFLDRNRLSFIEEGAFEKLEHLTELQLWGNRITAITSGTFLGLKNLEQLDLRDNRITKIPARVFSKMSRLSTLALSRNHITSMQRTAFDGLRQLQTLKLSYNNLVTLADEPFAHLPALLWLDLSNNQLQTLAPSVILTLPNLYNRSANILLEGNSFKCDCGLYWMYELYNDSKVDNIVLSDALKMVTCEDEPVDGVRIHNNLVSVPWHEKRCKKNETQIPEDEEKEDGMDEMELSQENRPFQDEHSTSDNDDDDDSETPTKPSPRVVKDTPKTFHSDQSQTAQAESTLASKDLAMPSGNSCQKRTLHIGLAYLIPFSISFSLLRFQSS